jgi:hypothetical protein
VFSDALQMPRLGPKAAALAQVRAQRAVRRVLRLLDAEQHDLVEHVVLRCQPFSKWYLPRRVSRDRALGKLVAVLDILVEHFQSELTRYGLVV